MTINEIEQGISNFDKTKPTCLATDWSKTELDIGYLKNSQCQTSKPFCHHTGWKIPLVGSCFTHPAESRYAPVESEALIADALDKVGYFVFGCENLVIPIDHKPVMN